MHDAELARFVGARLCELLDDRSVTRLDLAKIAGYDRRAFYRILDGTYLCNLAALNRIAQHFSVPLTYFVPLCSVAKSTDLNILRHARPICAPLTRRVVERINILPLAKKSRLLQLFDETGDLVELLEVALLFQKNEAAGMDKFLEMLRESLEVA